MGGGREGAGEEGAGEDGGTGGEIEREGSEVDGARATGEEAGGVSQGEGGDPVVGVDDGEGLGEKGGKSWYNVDDRLDGKGTGGEKGQLGVVEEEGNGGGVGGKRGLEWNKWRENHYGWDFIFSGEEEGRLVVEGNYIFFHDSGSVFSQWAMLGFRVGVNYFSSAVYT